LLAVDAVRRVGVEMMEVWNGTSTISEVIKVVDEVMKHPMESQWQDTMVKTWADKNKSKVCQSCSPSVLIDRTFHAIEHIDEAMKSIDKYLKESKVVETIAVYFQENSGSEIDEQKLEDFISDGIKMGRAQTLRVKKIQREWEHKSPRPEWCGGKTYQYKIKDGDTLTSISNRCQSSLEELKDMNLMLDDKIYAGSYLKIPRPIGGPDESHLHSDHNHDH